MPLATAAFLALACGEAGSPSSPGPDTDLPVSISTIETSLDFDDSPLRGELRIVPRENRDLNFVVDLDDDGEVEESGPLGRGVIVGYEFVEAGPHPIRVTLTDENGILHIERTVVVNDPGDLVIAARRTPEIDGGFGGITTDPEETAVYVSAPYAGLVLRFDPFRLNQDWRLPLSMGDFPWMSGGLATSADGNTLFVDVGDSLARIDVSGAEPGPASTFSRADLGNIVERLPNGRLLAGGMDGVLLIDPSTGAILAERDLFDGYDFAGSPDGRFVASINGLYILLLSADDLSEVWHVESDAVAYGAVAFSHSGESLLVLLRTRTGEWLLQVFEAETGELERRYLLGPTGNYLTWDRKTQPATHTADGRFVVFATDVGAFFVDAVTGLPRLREPGPAPDSVPIGCCNVVATEAGPLFASGLGYPEAQLARLKVDR